MKGQPGEYSCLSCNYPLEAFTGQTYVAHLAARPALHAPALSSKGAR